MSDEVPIMRLGPNLLVPLQGNLEDTTVEQIERAVTHEVARIRASGVLIDVSGLSIVDSFVARVIARLVAMVRLLGAEATIVGLQPAVAITLVELGVPMGHVRTALNAEQGMARLGGRRDERASASE
jgi:rsbT antagonist protein RsbS